MLQALHDSIKNRKLTTVNGYQNTNYQYPNACLIIMAKAPLPGFVKTRLIPAIGKKNAAKIQAAMLEDIAGTMIDSKICPVQIGCHPNVNHPIFSKFEQAGASLFAQIGNDLGTRMYHALSENLKKHDYAVLIGCDCPSITPKTIQQTFHQFINEGKAVVLGPAEDGGYYLIATKHVEQSWFEEIAWGTSEVFIQTRKKLRSSGVKWYELEILKDIDTADDLKHIAQMNRKLGQKINRLSLDFKNIITPKI